MLHFLPVKVGRFHVHLARAVPEPPERSINRRSHHVCPSHILEVTTRFQTELRVVELILTFFSGVTCLGFQLSTQELLTSTCHRHSIRCITRPMLNPVRTVLFVIRPCMKQFKIRSCVLQSVKVQVRRTSALTVRTPSSPGFVEWSMPSDAWVDTTELSGEKKKEQSPDTVMEEPTEPAPGTVIAQVEQQDAEEEPSEAREETRRVVLVTVEPEESTEVIVKPPGQEPERSTEVTEKPSEPVEEKGLETEKRESGDPKDLPEPEIPEKPFVAEEKAQEATSEQEVKFRMKAWSNWLHRQDQKDEEKRIRNRARQRALRQQRRSDREAGLQQAVRKGPSLRRSWTVTVEDPLPKGSVQKVLKHHTKAPRRERIVKLRLIEREVQASRVTAKGEYMIQNKHRAWITPKARPQAKSSANSSGSRVRKEFVEIPSLLPWSPSLQSRPRHQDQAPREYRSTWHI